MPNFDLWSQENLAKFAKEAYAKMQEQHDQIQQLQNELKDAIKAYRELNK
jgi:chaperonin cofactor prefoldin